MLICLPAAKDHFRKSVSDFSVRIQLCIIIHLFERLFTKIMFCFLEDYIWHWFILAGYEETGNDLLVKAVSYGEYKWFSLKEMWDTGYDKKGGMILYHI